MSSSCSVVSSVIAGAGNQKIKLYFIFLNKDKDTLTILIESLIGHYECELGVMYPFWMSGQTQHPPPTCCSLDEPEPSPLQTAARASLPEQLSPAPWSSLTSAKKKKTTTKNVCCTGQSQHCKKTKTKLLHSLWKKILDVCFIWISFILFKIDIFILTEHNILMFTNVMFIYTYFFLFWCFLSFCEPQYFI